MEPKNIEEYVTEKIVEYAFEHKKLKRKYDAIKLEFKTRRCSVCKKYSQMMLSKSCHHYLCSKCHCAETSLIFQEPNFKTPNRNTCIKCWIKTGIVTYDDLRTSIRDIQWEHYREYTKHLETRFSKHPSRHYNNTKII